MPYVTHAERRPLDPHLNRLGQRIKTVGQLTYAMTFLALAYIRKAEPSFARMGEGLLALEASKLEIARTELAPYERGKMEQNGAVDVSDTTTPSDGAW